MLKCIVCGKEYPEEFNVANDGCSENPNFTTLFSTSIKSFEFPPSPIAEHGYDGRQVFLKHEDQNPFGSFKDRKSAFLCTQSHRKFALATCGNQALSLANYELNEDVLLYVPSDISYKKLMALHHFYPKIIFADRILTTQELTEGESDRWNITNGMDPIGASAFYSLAIELEPYDFKNIIVPMGSGELWAALAVYFNLLRKQKVNVIPVRCQLEKADAVKGTFVPVQPFIDYFKPEILEFGQEAEHSIELNSQLYNCDFSSALVFEAVKHLELKEKTCLVITGAKN